MVANPICMPSVLYLGGTGGRAPLVKALYLFVQLPQSRENVRKDRVDEIHPHARAGKANSTSRASLTVAWPISGTPGRRSRRRPCTAASGWWRRTVGTAPRRSSRT